VQLREDLAEMPFDGTGADEELLADLVVGASVAGQASDVELLCGDIVLSVRFASADRIADGQQFSAGTLGEGFSATAELTRSVTDTSLVCMART
jgi:hypothetical protein